MEDVDLNWFEKSDLEKLIPFVMNNISLCNVKSIEKFLEVADGMMIPCPYHCDYKNYKKTYKTFSFNGINLTPTAISHLVKFLKNGYVREIHVDFGTEEIETIICKTIKLKSYCRCEEKLNHCMTHSIVNHLKNIIDWEREHFYSINLDCCTCLVQINIRYFSRY